MKAAKMIFPKNSLLVKESRKLFNSPEKISYHKFNKEIFYINLGSGLVFTIIGTYFIGTTQFNNTNELKSVIFGPGQRVVSVLPHSFKELFPFLIGNIFLLFGVICIFLALKLVVRYLASRLNN